MAINLVNNFYLKNSCCNEYKKHYLKRLNPKYVLGFPALPEGITSPIAQFGL